MIERIEITIPISHTNDCVNASQKFMTLRVCGAYTDFVFEGEENTHSVNTEDLIESLKKVTS